MIDERFLNDCERWALDGLRYQETKKLTKIIRQLLAVKEVSVRMLSHMKLINGPDGDCIIAHGTKECKNHRAIHDMEDALEPLRDVIV